MCYNHPENYDGDCLECIKEVSYAPYINRYAEVNNFDTSKYLNKFVRSKDKSVAVYKEPGGAPSRIAKPDTYIGKTVAFNSKMNWLKLNDGYWIVFDPTFIYREPDTNAKELTTTEKVSAALYGASSVGGAGAAIGADATKVLVAGGEKAADILPDFLGSLKWVLIGVLVLVIVAMLYKILK